MFINLRTMKKYKIFITILALFVSAQTYAQSIFNDLLPSTAKVMFIDSVVVDKERFLEKVPLNPESGKIMYYDEFFNTKTQVPCALYRNELGDRCYFALGDTTRSTQLYSIDRLGGEWSEPRLIKEFDKDFSHINYPFLMADGFTLFFSASGEGSMGGLDIFTTVFDSEEGVFYKPENYGLPFNSSANDYLIAFDELDSLGWLVSDRYQPEGKVCIYTFVPTFPRVGFKGSVDKDKLTKYAKLNSIKDTWEFGNRKQALARLKAMTERSSQAQGGREMNFVVNDQRVYHHANEFLSPTAKKLYSQYAELKGMVQLNEQRLDNQRNAYIDGNSQKKAELRQPILRLEHDIQQQKKDLKDLEKKIRNAENAIINHSKRT